VQRSVITGPGPRGCWSQGPGFSYRWLFRNLRDKVAFSYDGKMPLSADDLEAVAIGAGPPVLQRRCIVMRLTFSSCARLYPFATERLVWAGIVTGWQRRGAASGALAPRARPDPSAEALGEGRKGHALKLIWW
jgi:hypothetical protein